MIEYEYDELFDFSCILPVLVSTFLSCSKISTTTFFSTLTLELALMCIITCILQKIPVTCSPKIEDSSSLRIYTRHFYGTKSKLDQLTFELQILHIVLEKNVKF